MTFGLVNIAGVLRVRNGGSPVGALLPGWGSWPAWLQSAWGMLIQCHLGHALELVVAIVCYHTLWPLVLPRAAVYSLDWIAAVVAWHLACEALIFGFWHGMTYAGDAASGPLGAHKYNRENQYEPSGRRVGFLTSSTGHLQREVILTTAGWLMSSAYMCIALHLYATHAIAWYPDFWAFPAWSLGWLALGTYWREFHFYWVHRMVRSVSFCVGDLV